MLKSLVNYPDDDEDDELNDADELMSSRSPFTAREPPKLAPSPMLQTPPPERLSEKRRREEDAEEDELGKLTSSSAKRRNSGSSTSGFSSSNSNASNSNSLRRKKGFVGKEKPALAPSGLPSAGEKKKKMEISLAAKPATVEDVSPGDGGGDGG